MCTMVAGKVESGKYSYRLIVSPFADVAALQRASETWTGWSMPAEVPKERRERFFAWCVAS
eukprot:SAG31_NODE_2919_length_4912_cov_52.769790_3_plen_61_part_00